ncbi:hypothetical protein JCM19046_1798 [Bacillus sp. JCM 19046]|nr:hypothetical protein JCM19046_1798 [Bacillus sp. JCM 19046]
MIYTFLAGTCNDLKREKQETLLTLVKEVLNHLQPVTRSVGMDGSHFEFLGSFFRTRIY